MTTGNPIAYTRLRCKCTKPFLVTVDKLPNIVSGEYSCCFCSSSLLGSSRGRLWHEGREAWLQSQWVVIPTACLKICSMDPEHFLTQHTVFSHFISTIPLATKAHRKKCNPSAWSAFLLLACFRSFARVDSTTCGDAPPLSLKLKISLSLNIYLLMFFVVKISTSLFIQQSDFPRCFLIAS